jgi:ribosomal protein L23
MNLYNIIVKPIVTEKTSVMEVTGDKKTYTVQISPRATKVDVKNAFKFVY